MLSAMMRLRTTFGIPTRLQRGALLSAAVLTLSFTMAGCRSKVERADRLEATYDMLFAQGAYPPAAMMMQQAVALDESSPQRWLKLARAYDAMGQFSPAASAYQRALELQPDNIEALQNLAILTTRSGQIEMAQRYVQPLLLLDPRNPAGLLSSGAIALRQRNFAEANRIADAIIAAAPERSEGHVLRARIMDMQDNTRSAIRLLEERLTRDPQNRDILLLLLTFYQKLGDRDGIRATAVRLVPLFPDDPRYAMEAARAYQGRGDTARARQIIDDLRARFGTNPSLMGAVAQFWRSTMPADAARAEISRAAEGAEPPVRRVLARALLDMGDAAGATGLLDPLVKGPVGRTNIDAQALYARALFAAGRTQEGEAKVAAVLAYDGSNPDALVMRARTEMARGAYAAAATDVQRVRADDDANEEAALLLAEIYARQGNVVRAASAYGTARQSFPDSVKALRAEIGWLLAQKRYDEAADRASRFAHAHPGSSEARTVLAETCRATGPASCVNRR